MYTQTPITSDTVLVGLYGTGGFAREIMPLAREWIEARRVSDPRPHLAVFIETSPSARSVNGHRVLAEEEFIAADCAERLFSVTVADAGTRRRLVERCEAQGARPLTLQSSRSAVYDGSVVGEGSVLCDNSIVTVNSRVGRHVHLNLYSYVAHDCVVGDFVTFGPSVHCNGNVHIGAGAYIGTAVVIKQGRQNEPLVIGEGAVVGMGAVVTKDVPAHTTVVGNPARPLVKRVDGG
jgi:sugar O-acyltransferase (sialic acid O-acetyltransferase NeuD family)